MYFYSQTVTGFTAVLWQTQLLFLALNSKVPYVFLPCSPVFHRGVRLDKHKHTQAIHANLTLSQTSENNSYQSHNNPVKTEAA